VKEAGKILAYLCGVLLFGGLLAPLLYWGADALADVGLLTVLRRYPFQKFFNRAVLVAAVLLFWPLLRWLGMRGWRPPAFRSDPLWKGRLWTGFLLGSGTMVLLGAGLWGMGVYRFEGLPGVAVVLSLAGSAATVGLLEEVLFRGVLTGLFLRGLDPRGALWLTSGLFALVHFLKPDPSVRVPEVGWLSGFALIPHAFHQFANPLLFLGGFGTLLTLGLVLGVALQRTGSLWMSIGFHAGLVLVKGFFLKSFTLVSEFQPWAGPQLQVGLAPVVSLLLAGCAVLWRTKLRPAGSR
jgi:membrane protease YdiL (CAAX protease family)